MNVRPDSIHLKKMEPSAKSAQVELFVRVAQMCILKIITGDLTGTLKNSMSVQF